MSSSRPEFTWLSWIEILQKIAVVGGFLVFIYGVTTGYAGLPAKVQENSQVIRSNSDRILSSEKDIKFIRELLGDLKNGQITSLEIQKAILSRMQNGDAVR